MEDLFYPDLFIIGGGISKKFEKYSHLFTTNTKVLPALLQNHAGIIGSAVSAKHEETVVKDLKIIS